MSFKLMKDLGKYLTKGLTKDGKLDYGQLAGRGLPDLFFGGLSAAQTPGDITDKMIAFGTTAIPASLGGLAAAGIARNPHGLTAGLLDQAGSIAADYASFPAGEALMRAKDKLSGGMGLTPYERLSVQDQKIFEERLRRQIMTQYGLLPGTREQYAGMV